MNKTKATKKALLMSMLSMLICVAMLIGSTFAWFTDSVTSGRNQIIAGNLDVELEYAASFAPDGSVAAWEPVTTLTDLFAAPDGEEHLWEPGHTEVAYLRVRNAGSLALKYNLSAAVYGDASGAPENTYTSVQTDETGANISFKLSEHLVFNVIDGATQITDRTAAWLPGGQAAEEAVLGDLSGFGAKEAALYPAKTDGKPSEQVFTLAVYMPTWVGNEANYLTGTARPELYLGVQLDAAQLTYESDSFDDQYDIGAELPKTEPDAPVVLVPKTTWSNKNNLQGVIYNAMKLAGAASPVSATNATSIVFSNWDAYKDEVGGNYEEGMMFGAVPEDEPESSDETGARVFYNDDTKAVYFLTESKNAKIKAPADMQEMFRAYQSLTKIDLSGLDTSETTDYTRMFQYDNALTDFDLTSLDVSGATNFYAMFSNCKNLKRVNMEGWDTSNLTSVSSMFSNCTQLEVGDLSQLDLSHVTNFSGLFSSCSSLTEVNFGDSDLSAATNIAELFSGCTSLKSYDLTPFASAKLTSIGVLFKGCTQLTSMDLSMLDTSELTSISQLFSGCTNLRDVTFGEKFTTDKVTAMDNAFAGCSSLVTLDISTFNPSAADPANDGSGLSYMFKDCTSLKTIYASEQFVIQGRTGYYRCTHMFKNCTSLVGGDGTHFSNSILYQSDGNYQDFEYARIDGFEGKAGYFTDVAEKP